MTGELAALGAAFCWALAARWFRQLGESCPPLTLNLWKGLIALPGLLLIAWLAGNRSNLDGPMLALLLISGAIGIGVGDSFFFAAVNRVGDRPAVLVTETLAPVLAALLAILFLGEHLTLPQWVAIGLVLTGVAVAIRPKKKRVPLPGGLAGYHFAAIAALCQAGGAVISRDIMLTGNCSSDHAAALRLAGGLLILYPLLFWRRRPALPPAVDGHRPWSLLILATSVGTIAALGLMMLAFAHTEAAVVQTLIAASVLFSLILNALAGERPGSAAIVGSLLALMGIVFLLMH